MMVNRIACKQHLKRVQCHYVLAQWNQAVFTLICHNQIYIRNLYFTDVGSGCRDEADEREPNRPSYQQ